MQFEDWMTVKTNEEQPVRSGFGIIRLSALRGCINLKSRRGDGHCIRLIRAAPSVLLIQDVRRWLFANGRLNKVLLY